MAVATDHELQQELLDAPGCIPLLHQPMAHTKSRDGGGNSLQRARSAAGVRAHGAEVCGEDSLVVLVKRTGRTRRFARAFEKLIFELVEEGRHEDSTCQLRLAVYDGDAGQTPVAVLAQFAAARAVIAPHGAGLANLIAGRRGLRVLEFHPAQPEHAASGIPGLNLCMLHLARALGFAYTGALMWPVVEGEQEEGLFKANAVSEAEGEMDEDAGNPGDRGSTSWTGDVTLLRSWVQSLRQSVCAV